MSRPSWISHLPELCSLGYISTYCADSTSQHVVAVVDVSILGLLSERQCLQHAYLVLQAPLHAAGADITGILRSSLDRRRNQLLQLRCALARCLKDAVTPGARAAGVGGFSQELLVCVGHQAQVRKAVHIFAVECPDACDS